MRRAVFVLVLACSPMVSPVSAQTALPADATWHSAPGGEAIGTLRRGAAVRRVSTNGDWTMVTVEGWIASFRVASRSDTLDRTVTGAGTAPLREADGPTQRMLGEVEPGTVLKRLAERNGWTQVRRAAWIRTAALSSSSARAGAPAATSGAAGAATTGAGGAGAGDDTSAPPGAAAATDLRTVRPTTLRTAPGGAERASIRPGTTLETLARDGGWARVRIEGWVPERDLMVADSSADVRLSAADLRADPAGTKGKVVRWDVEVIALQRADALRRGLTLNEPYLIAVGAGDEREVLYLAIPEALMEEARAIPPLSRVLITARVRDGRSAPVGTPILDLLSLSRQ